MRISDWSSDVCSSDLDLYEIATNPAFGAAAQLAQGILTLGCLGNASPALNTLDLKDSFGDGEFSGTAVVSYKPMENLLVYGSYSRGYKAGGYNQIGRASCREGVWQYV